MTSETATTVISDFVGTYIEHVLSGRCRDDQVGLVFKLARGGYMFVAVDPSPVIDADPTALAPRDLYPVLAHAVFRPQHGRVHFSSPAAADGIAQHELDDPVYIQFQHGDSPQFWVLSMNRLHAHGEPIEVHRADPASLRLRAHEARAAHTALH
jgi:hypothetical protein